MEYIAWKFYINIQSSFQATSLNVIVLLHHSITLLFEIKKIEKGEEKPDDVCCQLGDHSCPRPTWLL